VHSLVLRENLEVIGGENGRWFKDGLKDIQGTSTYIVITYQKNED